MTSPAQSMLTIRALGEADVDVIMDFLASQPKGYLRYFHVFEGGQAAIAELLRDRVRDYYGGVFVQNSLEAIFSVRGWDEGYDIPTYGIVVRPGRMGTAVSDIILLAVRIIARELGATQLMAKIHPDNRAATQRGHKVGFVASDVTDESGNIIYYLDL